MPLRGPQSQWEGHRACLALLCVATARPSSDLCLTGPATPALDRLDVADALAFTLVAISFLLAATRVSRCSLNFARVVPILVSVIMALHVVEQCANARQLGGEVPPMAIPGVGSHLAFRTTAQRGEDLVIGRSLHVAFYLKKKSRLRCHKRPKSREETPKEGSDSEVGLGVATAYP